MCLEILQSFLPLVSGSTPTPVDPHQGPAAVSLSSLFFSWEWTRSQCRLRSLSASFPLRYFLKHQSRFEPQTTARNTWGRRFVFCSARATFQSNTLHGRCPTAASSAVARRIFFVVRPKCPVLLLPPSLPGLRRRVEEEHGSALPEDAGGGVGGTEPRGTAEAAPGAGRRRAATEGRAAVARLPDTPPDQNRAPRFKAALRLARGPYPATASSIFLDRIGAP